LELNIYAKTAGMDLIFDLNALLRDGKKWDDTNAKELIAFANKHNLKISWQLGNGTFFEFIFQYGRWEFIFEKHRSKQLMEQHSIFQYLVQSKTPNCLKGSGF
jgi:hypothetical protein